MAGDEGPDDLTAWPAKDPDGALEGLTSRWSDADDRIVDAEAEFEPASDGEVALPTRGSGRSTGRARSFVQTLSSAENHPAEAGPVDTTSLTSIRDDVARMGEEVANALSLVADRLEALARNDRVGDQLVRAVADSLDDLLVRVDEADEAGDHRQQQLLGAIERGEGTDDFEGAAEALGAVELSVGAVAGTVRGVDESVTALDGRLETIEARLDSLEHSVGAVGQSVGVVDESVGALEQNVASLRGTVSSTEANVGAVGDQLRSVGERLGSIEQRAEPIAPDEGRLADLDRRLAGVEQAVGSIRQTVSLVGDNVSSVLERLAALPSELGESRLESIDPQSTPAAEVDTQLTDLRSELAALRRRLAVRARNPVLTSDAIDALAAALAAQLR